MSRVAFLSLKIVLPLGTVTELKSYLFYENFITPNSPPPILTRFYPNVSTLMKWDTRPGVKTYQLEDDMYLLGHEGWESVLFTKLRSVATAVLGTWLVT